MRATTVRATTVRTRAATATAPAAPGTLPWLSPRAMSGGLGVTALPILGWRHRFPVPGGGPAGTRRAAPAGAPLPPGHSQHGGAAGLPESGSMSPMRATIRPPHAAPSRAGKPRSRHRPGQEAATTAHPSRRQYANLISSCRGCQRRWLRELICHSACAPGALYTGPGAQPPACRGAGGSPWSWAAAVPPGGPQPHSGRSSRGQGTRGARPHVPQRACCCSRLVLRSARRSSSGGAGGRLVSGGVVPVPGAW